MNNNSYRPLDQNRIYIDKTAELKKGISAFPSLYIEGAAATGKTTAVKMLLEHHPEVEHVLFRLGSVQEDFLHTLRQELPMLQERLLQLQEETQRVLQQQPEPNQQPETESQPEPEQQPEPNRQPESDPKLEPDRRPLQKQLWVIFEDLDVTLSSSICTEIKAFIRSLPECGRVIMIGRECAPDFLDLLWKREMELIGQETLAFTKNETREYAEAVQSRLKADDIYDLTHGWVGCVDLLFRMDEKNSSKKEIHELIESYELQMYIENEIRGSLPEEERKLLSIGCVCPWITEEMCTAVWGLENGSSLIAKLHKKGILIYNKYKKHYSVPRLLHKETMTVDTRTWIRLAQWFVKKRCIREAFVCVRKTGDKKVYREFLLRYYHKIPFIDVYYGDVLQWEDDRPEICYLKGMCYYSHQSFDKMRKEIGKVKNWTPSNEQEEHRQREIFLNLLYCDPKESFSDWMKMVEKAAEEKQHYNLYSMLGHGYSFLCGLRDISELFVGSKKEEAGKAELWKEVFGEAEWFGYCLARIDFYMETKQRDRVSEEDLHMLEFAVGKRYEEEWNSYYTQNFWRFRQSGLYLLCKWPELEGTDQPAEFIHRLEAELLGEERESRVRNTEAFVSLYSIWNNETERFDQWMRDFREERTNLITESNYMEMLQHAKGYILFGQYEKAEAILDRLMPYLRNYHRHRYYAESLFCKALLESETDKKGQSLRHMMESLLITGNRRYVNFYGRYGKRGHMLLESYIEWYKNAIPEDWHVKKKYNYGNVLRMPMADYLEVLVRGAKKEGRTSVEVKADKGSERLTMMETLMLHSIHRGLTNTQICEEQNLKLPTVKSHIYSLYKKLGVNSRVQALNRAKELGLVR